MTTNDTISQKSEILFIYDAVDCNPNGDPLDDNKPRIDEETGQCLVTDVRIKRTIRDFWYFLGGHNTDDRDIFVRDTEYKNGIADGKARASGFGKDKKSITTEVLRRCIDVRCFGGVLPLKSDSITFTGPVQFKMGRSLHRVDVKHIKGTGAFASSLEKMQKTFREEYLLHYALVATSGIVNQIAAQQTSMTNADLRELLMGLWHGTRNLVTRSKSQQPRMLIKINYKTPHFFIGNLDHKVSIQSELRDEQLRSTKDYALNLSNLLATLDHYSEHIESVEIQTSPDLQVDVPETWLPLGLE